MNELEKERLAALVQYNILDPPPEEEFEEIVELASQICNVPISLITLIDEHRQWFKANKGFGEETETPREVAFCNHTIQQDDILIVNNAIEDDRFKDNPLVTKENGIRFYAGVPLTTPQGFKLGSLCVIAEYSHKLDDEQIFALRTLGKQVMRQMELRKQNLELTSLLTEVYRQTEYLQNVNDFNRRLQSIVSHDLRNPINATRHFLDFLANGELSQEEIATWTYSIGKSLELFEKLLNSLTELGMGSFKNDDQQKEVIQLNTFVEELVAQGDIQFKIKQNKFLSQIEAIQLNVNPHLLEFVLRNLIQNANKFTQNGIITVIAKKEDTTVLIQVKDTGQGMDSEAIKHSFDFRRNKISLGTIGERGHGLGLVICKEFTERMKGRIWVESKLKEGSTFFVQLPIQ